MTITLLISVLVHGKFIFDPEICLRCGPSVINGYMYCPFTNECIIGYSEKTLCFRTCYCIKSPCDFNQSMGVRNPVYVKNKLYACCSSDGFWR